MTVTIYHNPRCSKSRQTLQLLQDKGVEPEVVLYLQDAPSTAELSEIKNKLGASARDFIRSGERVYKDLGLNDPDLGEQDLITAMAENPILIERPIVVVGDKAAIGRPPENVLDLL